MMVKGLRTPFLTIELALFRSNVSFAQKEVRIDLSITPSTYPAALTRAKGAKYPSHQPFIWLIWLDFPLESRF